MSSPKKDSSPSEQEISFDTYEIDYKIFKDKEFIQKCESKSNPKSSQLNKFKLIPGLTQELIQKRMKIQIIQNTSQQFLQIISII